MKKRLALTIVTLLVAALCLGVLSSCQPTKPDFFSYSEENLSIMGKLVKATHGWIKNYGWTVVVFTVFLKLLMTPLDLWQRVSSKKSALKMQKMQPLVDEIDKRYGPKSQRANEEKQKLYRKQGYSMFAMCLPMIISMVIFFIMFGGLRDYSTYSSIENFKALSNTYITSYYDAVDDAEAQAFLVGKYQEYKANSTVETELGKETNARLHAIDDLQNNYGYETCLAYRTTALAKVAEFYKENHESWLWIDNVWQPDTWATVMPTFDDRQNGFKNTVNMQGLGVGDGQAYYEMIRSAVLTTGGHGPNGTWNGLMLLPFLSVGLSFLSIFVTQQLDKHSRKGQSVLQNAPQNASNKTMMIVMPLMMAFFGFMYTGAFAIYMVSNYLLSIISSVAMYFPAESLVQKSMAKAEAKDKTKSNKANYMR